MKKTRILCLVLALLMCVGMASVFSSCAKGGEVKLSKKTIDIDLTEYTVVYTENKENKDGTSYRDAVIDFGNKIQAATGLKLIPVTQNRADDSRYGKEILIGLTDRDESIAAYEKIKGYGFTIEVTENKIVIVGTTRLLTLTALQFFASNYLTAETPNTTITVNKTAKAKKMEMITLAAPDTLDIPIVYDSDIDDDPSVEYGSTEGAREGFGYDYVYERAAKAREYLLKAVGMNGAYYALKKDTEAAAGNEVLMGIVNREACTAVLAKLGAEEYGVCVQDGSIVATGWSDVGQQLASEMLLDLIKESKEVDPDDESKVVYIFPSTFDFVRTANSSWVLNFPKPEGENIALFNTMDCSDGAFQHLYRGSGVNMDAFDAYCEQLRVAGYTPVSGPYVVEGSAFATYTNKYKNVMLHVSFDAFTHASEVSGTTYSGLPVSFDGSEDTLAVPGLRIVSTKLDNAYMDEILFNKTNSKLGTTDAPRRTDAAVVAVKLPGESVGTGYVIMLEDGSFIVLDGGARGDNGTSDVEADNIFNILTSLYREYSDTSKALRIRAWVNSHAHGDHTSAFLRFAHKYGKGGGGVSVKLEYIIASYPSDSMSYNTAEGSSTPYATSWVQTLRTYFSAAPKIIEPRTGQRLYFPGLEIEVLATNEDLNPQGIVTGNDASTLLRFNLTPTKNNAPQRDKTVSLMWTGDMYRYGGQFASAMYGNYLKSDMVTLTHHGGPGADEQFFKFVDAEIVWWPHTATSACGKEGTLDKPTGGYMKSTAWYAMADQLAVSLADYIFTATDYNIALFLSVEGPLFNEIKNIENGVKDIKVERDHDGRNFLYRHLLQAAE